MHGRNKLSEQEAKGEKKKVRTKDPPPKAVYVRSARRTRRYLEDLCRAERETMRVARRMCYSASSYRLDSKKMCSTMAATHHSAEAAKQSLTPRIR